MRYIGNKTKLLPFIGQLLDELQVPRGRALDAFAGTAAVGSYLKNRGQAVVGCDLMTFSYVLQRAYVVTDAFPLLAGLAADPDLAAARRRRDFAVRVEGRIASREAEGAAAGPPEPSRALDEVLVYLDSYLDPQTSFVSRHFAASEEHDQAPTRGTAAGHGTNGASAGGRLGGGAVDVAPSPPRMYFTLDGARRIDAIRHRLHEWRQAGAISDDEYYVLLAALIEGADAIANTTGVYAAYMKQWQPNALRALHLRFPPLATRERRSGQPRCEAHQGDVSVLAPRLGHFDLLYIDPPYNTRQYSAYYHIPELIARGWFDDTPVLRGKTGLLPNGQKSEWSTRAGCVAALDTLLAETSADHVVMSYNSEGIIPESEITRLFRAHGRPDSYRRVTCTYPRYRSDRPSATRRYKSDSVHEHLYCMRLRHRP